MALLNTLGPTCILRVYYTFDKNHLFIYLKTMLVEPKSHTKSLWSKYQKSSYMNMQLFFHHKEKNFVANSVRFQGNFDHTKSNFDVLYAISYSVIDTNGNHWCNVDVTTS